MELKDPIEHYLQRVNALDRRQFLRPMNSGEVLERAARIYQLSARDILSKTAVPTLFCYISLVFMTAFLLPNLFLVGGGEKLNQDLSQVGIAALFTIFLAIPLFMFGLGQSYSISIKAVKDYVTGDRLPGEPPLEQQARVSPWQFTLLLSGVTIQAFLPVFLASLMFVCGALLSNTSPDSPLAAVFAMFGFFLAMIAFFLTPVLLMRNSLVPVVAVVEGKGAKESRNRGRSLAKTVTGAGGIWESMLNGLIVSFFVGLALLGMVELATSFILSSGPVDGWLGSVVFGDLVKSGVQMLSSYVVLWLMTPFWAALSTTVYYDRRIRVEGFDIRMLAKDVLEVRE